MKVFTSLNKKYIKFVIGEELGDRQQTPNNDAAITRRHISPDNHRRAGDLNVSTGDLNARNFPIEFVHKLQRAISRRANVWEDTNVQERGQFHAGEKKEMRSRGKS